MNTPLLMIPGPCAVDEEVLAEMSKPLVPHYGEEWAREYNETRNAIKPLLGTENEIYLVVSSGHAAVEMAVNALAGAGEKILVVDNGFFGERIATIARSYGIETVMVKEEWGKPVDAAVVEETLRQQKDIKAVAMVHGETSTGLLNPVQEIGKVVRRFKVPFFVDAVCSIGGTEFLMDEWGVDVCVTASQKGLAAPPGLAIISVSKKGWQAISERKSPPVGWYLNLLIWREFAETQKDYQPYGITMTVNNVKALKVSLNQIYQEGLPERYQRHNEISQLLREGLQSLGLETLAKGAPLPLVTAVKCPVGIRSQEVVSFLKEKYAIHIGGGLGEYKESIFRIGHMGLGANKEAIERVLAALADFFKSRVASQK